MHPFALLCGCVVLCCVCRALATALQEREPCCDPLAGRGRACLALPVHIVPGKLFLPQEGKPARTGQRAGCVLVSLSCAVRVCPFVLKPPFAALSCSPAVQLASFGSWVIFPPPELQIHRASEWPAIIQDPVSLPLHRPELFSFAFIFILPHVLLGLVLHGLVRMACCLGYAPRAPSLPWGTPSPAVGRGGSMNCKLGLLTSILLI